MNFAGNKTEFQPICSCARFESYVNFAGNKTETSAVDISGLFESYVNFAGNKTYLRLILKTASV